MLGQLHLFMVRISLLMENGKSKGDQQVARPRSPVLCWVVNITGSLLRDGTTSRGNERGHVDTFKLSRLSTCVQSSIYLVDLADISSCSQIYCNQQPRPRADRRVCSSAHAVRFLLATYCALAARLLLLEPASTEDPETQQVRQGGWRREERG